MKDWSTLVKKHTGLVLQFIEEFSVTKVLNATEISEKTAILLALTSAHSLQTLAKINIQNIDIQQSEILIKIPDFRIKAISARHNFTLFTAKESIFAWQELY